jgi:hypothetical protein
MSAETLLQRRDPDHGPNVPWRHKRAQQLWSQRRSRLDAGRTDGDARELVGAKKWRRAQVSTKMDIYGGVLMHAKREANIKVARMVLKGDPSCGAL